MKNLIRIGIPDAAEKMGIRQAAFEGVVGRGQSLRKGLKIGLEDFKATGVETSEPLRALHKVKRSSFPRSRLSQDQAASRKVKGGERTPRTQSESGLAPMEASGDHEVQHKPAFVIESDGDALAQSLQVADKLTPGGLKRRTRRAQQEWTCQPDIFQPLPKNSRPQSFEIYNDVRKLRHDSPSCHACSRRAKWNPEEETTAQ